MNLRRIGISWRITVPQSLYNIRQLTMLPTYQDISCSTAIVVTFHEIGDAVLIVTVTGSVDGETQVGGEWLDGFERALAAPVLIYR